MAAKRHPLDLKYGQNFPKEITGLYLAGSFGASKAADILLRYEQSPDLKDTYSSTQLWYAAWKGHETVKLLLLAGTDANAASIDRQIVLQIAAMGGQLKVVEKLLAALPCSLTNS